MRLLPMTSDKSWRSIRAQWKKDAESVGEDFSTFSNGSYAAFDALTKDGENPSLYCLSDGEKIHATCQVSRLMMSKFPTPILRARFVVVSPIYELGVADAGQYAQTLVALFCGIVWLSRDSMSAGHIRFFLKSPGDAQFFAALRVVTEVSPFSAFTTAYGKRDISCVTSACLRPMKRLIEKTVFSGLVTAWRFAT